MCVGQTMALLMLEHLKSKKRDSYFYYLILK